LYLHNLIGIIVYLYTIFQIFLYSEANNKDLFINIGNRYIIYILYQTEQNNEIDKNSLFVIYLRHFLHNYYTIYLDGFCEKVVNSDFKIFLLYINFIKKIV
jgi:hypothetical protein